MSFRIGIDVGGTFTDLLVTDESGKSRVYKTLTSPENPAEGVFTGLGNVADHLGLGLPDFLARVTTIVHGTTIGTNAVLTGRGAKTGFITTKGFRDVLNLRRGLKERQWDFKYAPPVALVPRHRTYGVSERVDRFGQELEPLNESELREAVNRLKDDGVESIAISFMWSFLNPAHEQRSRTIIEELMPGVYVSLSSEVLPQIRLYERNSTTALNAYVAPLLAEYLRRLYCGLSESGFGGTLLIMQSNGGVMSLDAARQFPANTLLSGPAAGPVAGAFYGEAAGGFSDIITVDMGGTSFDVALIKEGKPTITTEGRLGGYRLAIPIVDIHSIGAGGGSIAWVDSGGILGVGPQSAGARPGPACYDRGGEEPTVTDADLLLGYLNPEFFWGGELRLDPSRAEQAINDRIATKLGVDSVTAARGIYEVINANMADALRVVSIQRGYDPREFALVVAGGAGPIHAAMIAEQLEIPLVIVPRDSSVFCAAGMLLSDLKHDFVRSYRADLTRVDISALDQLYSQMEEEALGLLESEGMKGDRVWLSYSADLRYVGQVNEVEVAWSKRGKVEPADLEQLVSNFHAAHESLFGYSLPHAQVEIMNVRLMARGQTEKPALEKSARADHDASRALKGERGAYFGCDLLSVPVYDGLKLGYGHSVCGPAIIEQPTTTLVVTAGYDVSCDAYGNYLLHLKGREIEELARTLRKEK